MFRLLLQVQTIHPEKGITQSRAWYSKSFVKNVLGCLAPQMDQENTYTTVDTGANSRTNSVQVNSLYCPIGCGDAYQYGYYMNEKYKGDELGIQIGTGNAANTAITYTLHQRVNHGKASGEMEYFGGTVGVVIVDGANTYFDIERIFRNSSGGSIAVSEYSIVVIRDNQYGYSYPTLIVRDVFSGGDIVTVADTEIFKVTYTPIVTV